MTGPQPAAPPGGAPFGAVRQHVLITDEEAGQKAFDEARGFSQFGEAMPGRTFVRVGG